MAPLMPHTPFIRKSPKQHPPPAGGFFPAVPQDAMGVDVAVIRTVGVDVDLDVGVDVIRTVGVDCAVG